MPQRGNVTGQCANITTSLPCRIWQCDHPLILCHTSMTLMRGLGRHRAKSQGETTGVEWHLWHEPVGDGWHPGHCSSLTVTVARGGFHSGFIVKCYPPEACRRPVFDCSVPLCGQSYVLVKKTLVYQNYVDFHYTQQTNVVLFTWWNTFTSDLTLHLCVACGW